LEHQWIALSNPESSSFSSVQAILRVSISVQAEGDEQIDLQDPIETETDPDQVIMIPASIKKIYKQLKIRFLMAEYLPKLDTLGTLDAYITMSFGGKDYKSKPAVT
jgi:regulator of sigma D